jgi:hypothetical protein
MRAVSLLTAGASPPESYCRVIYLWYSEFDKFLHLAASRNFPVLYPQREHTTLVQKLFRREPAIARFD